MKLDAPFTLDFTLDQKAVTEEDDGSVYVQGYASDFGMDRQDEAFEPGAFDAGLKSFMQNPVVLYHHKFDTALGQVVELDNRQDGLWVKAKLDAPEPGTEKADIIRKVKSGTIRGFSVGGKFYRRKGHDGKARIHKADIMELSITPLPINSRMLMEVVGKAFEDDFLAEAPEDELSESDAKAILAKLEDISAVFDEALDQIEGKADLSAGGRRKAAKAGYALPDGSFPIVTVQDLKNAIHAFGRAKNKAAAKQHIIKRARALGRTDLLPEGWS